MKKVTIPCSCGCSVVTIVEFDEIGSTPREIFADFYTMAMPPFWSRLSTAWKVFRRKDHWIHDVNLDEEGLKELRDYLNEIMEDKHVESVQEQERPVQSVRTSRPLQIPKLP